MNEKDYKKQLLHLIAEKLAVQPRAMTAWAAQTGLSRSDLEHLAAAVIRDPMGSVGWDILAAVINKTKIVL